MFLIVPDPSGQDDFPALFEAVLRAGDVASVLFLPDFNQNYDAGLRPLIEVSQRHDVATLLLNDSQKMGRLGADGLHLEGALEDIVASVKAHSGNSITGVGDLSTRHDAMVMGEGPVDYLFFGRLDGDRQPEIYKKSFLLAEWWASLFEVPAVVMGGNDGNSVKLAADAAIDFVALNHAIWQAEDPVAAVRHANQLLDLSYAERQKEAAL